MKRMVLIPEEKLIRYEKQLNDQPPTNEQAGGSIFPIHYPVGNYPGHDYLYNYPKFLFYDKFRIVDRQHHPKLYHDLHFLSCT